MEVHQIKTPAAVLASAVLAHKTIKPPLKSARQLEIGAINRQHARVIDDASVEPIRQDQLDPKWAAICIGRLFPLVDPGEAMPSPLCRLTDRRQHGRCLKSVETRLQPIIVACAGAAADAR